MARPIAINFASWRKSLLEDYVKRYNVPLPNQGKYTRRDYIDAIRDDQRQFKSFGHEKCSYALGNRSTKRTRVLETYTDLTSLRVFVSRTGSELYASLGGLDYVCSTYTYRIGTYAQQSASTG